MGISKFHQDLGSWKVGIAGYKALQHNIANPKTTTSRKLGISLSASRGIDAIQIFKPTDSVNRLFLFQIRAIIRVILHQALNGKPKPENLRKFVADLFNCAQNPLLVPMVKNIYAQTNIS